MSLPTRERELKLALEGQVLSGEGSLPTRERELKLLAGGVRRRRCGSLPTRERELKRRDLLGRQMHRHVAPYTGA